MQQYYVKVEESIILFISFIEEAVGDLPFPSTLYTIYFTYRICRGFGLVGEIRDGLFSQFL